VTSKTSSRRGDRALSMEQYASIASFRFQLRRFLAFSEAAAAAEGLPTQQHQALLAIAGRLPGEPASVGYLAQQLLVAPHTAAELTSRMMETGLLAKSPSKTDRRRVELTLTAKADDLLGRLTEAHLKELRMLEPALVAAVEKATLGAFASQPELNAQAARGRSGSGDG
jgi:DNA-binding MarR family transcriptional regulator